MQEGNTALHLAAKAGHMAVVQELLRAGADASAVNKVCGMHACSGMRLIAVH
jgi:ankyrin repeat protein